MGLSTKQVSDDQQQQSDECPRCESTNTKFCYYNNYNKSQPRHYCKSCKRHWTKGGSLRNVPIGGGRKNKRPKISSNVAKSPKAYGATTTTTTTTDIPPCLNASQNSNTEFQISSVSDKIEANNNNNASLFPNITYQYLNVYDQYCGNFDSIEESTITTVNNIPTTSDMPWTDLDNGGTMNLSNYWNWNEIDQVINSSDNFNISWDDYHEEIVDDDGGVKIKP